MSEDRIGSRIRCKNCQAPIAVVDDYGEGFDDDFGPPQPAHRKPGNRKKKSKRKSQSSLPTGLLIGGGVAGLLLIVGIIAVIVFSKGDGGDVASNEGSSGESDGMASISDSSLAPTKTTTPEKPVALSAEEKAQRQAAYEAQLEKRRLQQSQEQREDLVQRFGNDNVVTVTFSNVAGDTDAANKYLHRKVFRAAYKDYSEGSKRAREQTEANRKQAEEEALSNSRGQFVVFYHYRRVESDVPYPQVVNAGRSGDRMTYHVGPAIDPSAFAQRLGVGEVSSIDGRNINVTVYLPVPIPDPDVEDLVVAYGADQVLSVKVHGALGDARAVKMYIEEETRKAAPDGKFTFVAFKDNGEGNYEFTVGPIVDQRGFANSLGWGSIDSLADNVLTLTATLPADMPTYEEMVEAKKVREQKERAIQEADRQKRPRPDESELDWAVRCLKDNVAFTEEKALNALINMDIDKDRLEEVAKVIELAMLSATWHTELYVKAFVHWRTDRTEKIILSMGGRRELNPQKRQAFMEAFVTLGTEKCAQALASALPDFFAGDQSVDYLIKMGAIAEQPTLSYLKHKDARVRGRVYKVLREIGTKDSLTKLRDNVRLETGNMKAAANECYETIRDRTKDEAKPEKTDE